MFFSSGGVGLDSGRVVGFEGHLKNLMSGAVWTSSFDMWQSAKRNGMLLERSDSQMKLGNQPLGWALICPMERPPLVYCLAFSTVLLEPKEKHMSADVRQMEVAFVGFASRFLGNGI